MLPRCKLHALGIVCAAPLFLVAQTPIAPPPASGIGSAAQAQASTTSVRTLAHYTHSRAQILAPMIEARDANGDLFGFERTAAIANEAAESIVRAAKNFGQEDDITVVTLSYAPVEVTHA